MKYILQIQFFASKKGVGSTKNGRDSHSKRLGIKKYDGEKIKAGQIIFRQRGTKIFPGSNVGMGKDFTLYSLSNGVVKYKTFAKNKKKVIVINA